MNITTSSTDKTQMPETSQLQDEHTPHVHGPNCSHHHHHDLKPITRLAPKIGRNDVCLCGSGKKFKKCCGPKA